MESQRLLLGVTVFAIIVFTLFLGKPTVTGFVSVETFSQPLDLDVSESQRFVLDADSRISSLSLSGSVNGPGLVNVLLSDDDGEKLVYSNKKREGSSFEHITGMASLDISEGPMLDRIDSLPSGYVARQGVFHNECVETCILDPALGNKLYLDFIVEPGTTLHVSEIRFTSSK